MRLPLSALAALALASVVSEASAALSPASLQPGQGPVFSSAARRKVSLLQGWFCPRPPSIWR